MNWKRILTKRKPDTYKNNYGHTLIIGGSPGLTGAVSLASLACLRVGAGLVTVGVPSELNNIFETKLNEVMSLPLKSKGGFIKETAFKDIEDFIFKRKVDVLGIGPGLGINSATQKLVEEIIKKVKIPIVLDADALTILSLKPEILKKPRTKIILTPHLGEFSRLVKKSVDFIRNNRKKLAKDFSLRYNLILVLKGHKTLIAEKGKIYENNTGNPGMATAGSGDVLSGIICGLISQLRGLGLKKPTLSEAVKLGVYLHGLAGDLAIKEKTQAGILASDIIEYLPQAIKLEV